MPYKLNPFTRKLDFYEPSASVDSGEANLASNLGGGEGVFASKSGVTLQFKSILAGSNKTTLASDESTVTIDIDSSEIAHADLNGAGTSTHGDIDTHLGDATKHRVINDSGTAETELWSASKINSEFSSKAGLDHIHFINPRLVLKEQFAGNGEQTVFDLTGIILNGTFSTGVWSADNVLTTEAAHVTKTTKKALYDSLNIFTRNRIAVSSIAANGAVTLDYAPLAGEEFYIWYWYEIQDFDVVDDYYREDFVAEMEATGSEFIDPMTTRGDIILRDSSNYTNRLPVGSVGQVLQSDGSDPSWQTLEAVDVSDFDTEVSNNADVSANTSARHDAVTLHSSATTGGLSLSTQEISFQAATSEQSGYLTSTDWSTFNGKSDYSDPLTTRGDLLYRNSSNNTARLAVGTNAQVIRSDGTDVSWSSLVAGDLDISSLGVYGFENQTATSIGFNDSTYVFTLTDGGSGWSYWRNGKRITISGNKTVTLSGTPPAADIYYIYIDDDSGTLTASTSAWTLADTKVPVAIIEWNNSNTPKYFLANERHQVTMPRSVHYYEHFSEGTKLKSGGVLAGYTVAPSSPSDTDNTFSISQVELLDEDLLTTSALLSDPNGTDLAYIAYFRTGASTWSWEQSAVPFRYTAAGYIQYDNAGTMTEGGATKYFNWYLCFTNYQNQPRFLCVPGQSQFDSSSEAYDESVSDLDLSGFDLQELIFAYKLTFYTSNSYSSKGKCRLVRAPAFLGIASISTSISAGTTNHNTLGGLQGGTTNEYYHLTATTHSYINQDVTTTGTPSFTSVTVGNTGLSVGSSTPFSDSSGTLTLQNIDALDATTEATIESAIDTLANLTSIQGHTVTLTGDLVRSGAHSLTFTTTDTTNVTLPTSGTLATTAQISNMVTSSSTITDHAIVRGDGGSRGAQTSAITIDDSDRVQSVKNLGFTSTYDNGNSTASFTLTLSNGQLQKVTLTADSVAMTIVDTGNIGDGQWRITVLQDDTGGRSITSATVSGGTVRTEGGAAPTFSSGIGDEDTMIIIKEGTKYSIQVAATDWQTWT